jgi:hypothetical protein
MKPPVCSVRAEEIWAVTSASVYVRPSEKSWSHGTRSALPPTSCARKSRSENITVDAGSAFGSVMLNSPEL